jgi:hypothetical protein
MCFVEALNTHWSLETPLFFTARLIPTTPAPGMPPVLPAKPVSYFLTTLANPAGPLLPAPTKPPAAPLALKLPPAIARIVPAPAPTPAPASPLSPADSNSDSAADFDALTLADPRALVLDLRSPPLPRGAPPERRVRRRARDAPPPPCVHARAHYGHASRHDLRASVRSVSIPAHIAWISRGWIGYPGEG